MLNMCDKGIVSYKWCMKWEMLTQVHRELKNLICSFNCYGHKKILAHIDTKILAFFPSLSEIITLPDSCFLWLFNNFPSNRLFKRSTSSFMKELLDDVSLWRNYWSDDFLDSPHHGKGFPLFSPISTSVSQAPTLLSYFQCPFPERWAEDNPPVTILLHFQVAHWWAACHIHRFYYSSLTSYHILFFFFFLHLSTYF
jgi:hypothetical protein